MGYSQRWRRGGAVLEAVGARAERAVRKGFKGLGWTEGGTGGQTQRGDPGKVKLARELRAKTTVPLERIAQGLCMGRRGYLAWLVSRRNKGPRPSDPNQALSRI